MASARNGDNKRILITAFFDRTNRPTDVLQPPTFPWKDSGKQFAGVAKRRGPTDENLNPRAPKRAKLSGDGPPNLVKSNVMDQNPPARPRRRRTVAGNYGILKAQASGCRLSRSSLALSTRPVLESFVSSNKTDVYKCQATDPMAFLSPPYACAFNHESKRGRTSVLAVATEQGTLELINTARRSPWDAESSRTIIHVHRNAIFDVAWSKDDTRIATASGDQKARICDPQTQTIMHTLQGHSSTLKCVAWDPNHSDLLATAGRDGCVLLWDLRETPQNGHQTPVLKIQGAHELRTWKTSAKYKKCDAPSRSVTSILYLPHSPNHIVSSGSNDGILRKWDVRCIPVDKPSRHCDRIPQLTEEYPYDPTTQGPSHRARGISSLILGTGPTESVLFGLGNDSQIYTYNSSGASDVPLTWRQPHGSHNTYGHKRMRTNSFYVRLSISPCGRWLASGSSTGSVFLFDVGSQSRFNFDSGTTRGVELIGQAGEVGAVDWADGQLATCADDETVRIWRPDLDTHKLCIDDPEEAKWSWSWANAQ